MSSILLSCILTAMILVVGATAAPATDRAPFVCVETVNAPRQAVWDAISTNAGWKAFLGVDTHIEMRQGGPFEMYFASDAPEGSRGGEGNTILAFLPEELLAFTWNAPPKFEKERPERTWVVIQLISLTPQRTQVRLTHSGWDEPGRDTGRWHEVRAYFQTAWPSVLAALRRSVEQPPANAHMEGSDRLYLYHINPARDTFEQDATAQESAVVGDHFEYLKEAVVAGRVLLAGPTEDGCGGIVIFRATNEQEARAFVDADPAVAAGVFKASVHPFRLSLFAPGAAVQ